MRYLLLFPIVTSLMALWTEPANAILLEWVPESYIVQTPNPHFGEYPAAPATYGGFNIEARIELDDSTLPGHHFHADSSSEYWQDPMNEGLILDTNLSIFADPGVEYPESYPMSLYVDQQLGQGTFTYAPYGLKKCEPLFDGFIRTVRDDFAGGDSSLIIFADRWFFVSGDSALITAMGGDLSAAFGAGTGHWASVPEPGTVILFAIGLVALIFLPKKNRGSWARIALHSRSRSTMY